MTSTKAWLAGAHPCACGNMLGNCAASCGNCRGDCCNGVRRLTPAPIWNPPGRDRLDYRVGTYASFFASMQAGLSGSAEPMLAGLRTRRRDDAAVALLDAWSVVGDVLGFYQERIANEAYLRTATERRSLLELGRLVGYTLRPGVAASVYLAYTMTRDALPVTIPAGAKVNSVPAPGEQMQTFETAEPLEARWEWNLLKPRQAQPQVFAGQDPGRIREAWLAGVATGLRPNDRVLLAGAAPGAPQAYQVRRVLPEPAPNPLEGADRTLLDLAHLAPAASPDLPAPPGPVNAVPPGPRLLGVLDRLAAPPSTPPAHPAHLERSLAGGLAPASDVLARTLTRLSPALAPVLYPAMRGAAVAPADPASLHALRLRAAPFGHNAPKKPVLDARGQVVGEEEWPLDGAASTQFLLSTLHGDMRVLQLSGSHGADSYTWSPSLYDGEAEAQWGSFTKVRVRAELPKITVKFSALPTHDLVIHLGDGPAAPVSLNIGRHTISLLPEQRMQAESGRDRVTAARSLDPETRADRVTVDVATLMAPPRNELPLDMAYEQLVPGGWVLVERADRNSLLVTRITGVRTLTKTAYGLTARATVLTLADNWLDADDVLLSVFRATTVHLQSELLPLAERPLSEPVCGKHVELDGLVEGLAPGRWLIVAGERTDITLGQNGTEPVKGVQGSERVMLAAVRQGAARVAARPGADGDAQPLPGDTSHTFLELSTELAYCYRRETLRIYGNVVKATHGESVSETLGSGAAGQALQAFTLKQPPLTHVSAPTASGVASTLEVRVNELAWQERDSLANAGPAGRGFVTRTDDAGRTTIVFGDGVHGARLPTGTANVKAVYRTGIGKAGNVRAGQITLLNTRPLGVSEVLNPIGASGGADREGRDQARRNLPLGLLAFDRLVSTPDYADFARTFGGIGKAAAVRLADGRRQRLHLTVAGVDDTPVDPGGDLYRNLFEALHRHGDPHLPLTLAVRERLALVVAAKLRVAPGYRWETLEPRLRAAMLDAFGFERCGLAEDLLLADAIGALQAVAGVAWVDVDVFDAVSADDIVDGFSTPIAAGLGARDRIAVHPARIGNEGLLPAQLAYLDAQLPETLILQEIKP